MKIPEDPFVRELLPEFVDTWINDIQVQFDSLIKEENSEDLYRMAHTLKGSCFQFSLDEIAELGIKLMGLAKEKNWTDSAKMKDQLVSKFQEVKKYLDENGIK